MTLREKFNQAQDMSVAKLIPALQDEPRLVKEVDDNGGTLLFHACVKRDMDRIVALISEGADPNQVNDYQVTPLETFMIAATRGVQRADNYNDMILHILIESGAFPTQLALEKAMNAGQDEWVDYMVEKTSSMPKPK